MYIVASWACEITEILTQETLEKPLLCEDYSDLTSPNSNKIPDIHITVFVVYDTFSKLFFLHACSNCLV